ncbi:MAG: TldD/PmbA family protein [Candidatus Aquicultorales bacterium]
MKELTSRALDLAQTLGASYADIRIVEEKSQSVSVKNAQVEEIGDSSSAGFGVRVLYGGAWGFASSFNLKPAEVDRVTALAVDIAKASSIVKGKGVVLSPVVPIEDSWASPYEVDPFTVSLDDKVSLLLKADETMRSVPGISLARAAVDLFRLHKIFASTDGTYVEQETTESGAFISATAIQGGDIQTRSYPNSHGPDSAQAGFEWIESLDLVGNAGRIGEEAVALLSADECPSGSTDIVLDGSQLALQVHESCGHPAELDRVLGMEASYAGTSFLTTEKQGQLRYGSPLVNIVADATLPKALGSFAWDDEGVPAQRTELVRAGVFVGYLTSRETAPDIGENSNACMRADGWNRIPLIRMTNINLVPGETAFEDLFADVKDGIYMSTNKSWSIDDKRLNFQFACEIAWEIKDGKRGKMLKNPNYTGITPRFWGACDAIADDRSWRVWGLNNCGKGEPSQVMHVAHGASPARFRGVEVGIGR